MATRSVRLVALANGARRSGFYLWRRLNSLTVDRVTLAIIGAGNVQCSSPVLATIASYFGERPLDVVLYDADEERLDLFDRLARTFFAFTKSGNTLASTTNADEALAEAELVIVQLDRHGAIKALGPKNSSAKNILGRALAKLLANASPSAEVLSLMDESVELPVPSFRRLTWPKPVNENETVAVPHQALRWIHGEEYPFEFFAEHEDSPLKLWLDDPKTATLAKG